MNHNDPIAILTDGKIELTIKDLPARLGRNSNVVDVYLFQESVSREHCLFECIDRKFAVRDLGSSVGTFVNGVKLEPDIPCIIEDGAEIQFGKVKMEFHADYQALAEWESRQPQPESKNMVYTQVLDPFLSEELEAEATEKEAAEIASEELETEIAEEAEPASWEYTQVLDPVVSEALEAVAADKSAEENAAKPVKTLHLTLIDDVSGETKDLRIDHYPFAIGRKPEVNDYTIVRKEISRKHMRFEEFDGEIYLYDEASTNGVRLNGTRVEPETMVKLNSGDRISIVDITFDVRID